MPNVDDFTFTIGLAGGEVIQFAVGRWPGAIGAGIAITEDGFDLVEPHLRATAPGWTAAHRYGVFELNPDARQGLAKHLRSEADRLFEKAPAALFGSLADWLEQHSSEDTPVSIFGI